jgi:hypothetical protein
VGALLRRSSSAARSSSLISRHTVDRRDPDRRTCPAASSSRSNFRVLDAYDAFTVGGKLGKIVLTP